MNVHKIVDRGGLPGIGDNIAATYDFRRIGSQEMKQIELAACQVIYHLAAESDHMGFRADTQFPFGITERRLRSQYVGEQRRQVFRIQQA